ncbi:MAG: hypothetical protein ACRD1C_06785 [Terriglobales bacterium]
MKRHCNDRQLVAQALGYGTTAGAGHIAACAACEARLRTWQRTLNAAAELTVPAASEPHEVWQRLAPQLEAPPRQALPRGFGWALAVAACAAVLAFWFPRPHPAPSPAALAAVPVPLASPLLRAVVSDHLDRSQVLLVQLAHANSGPNQPVNLSIERVSARNLLAANRLYHQSAAQDGDAMVAHVLGALEPALTEIAHSPNQLTPEQWRQMQNRISASGVLFKVRVLDQTLRTENGDL